MSYTPLKWNYSDRTSASINTGAIKGLDKVTPSELLANGFAIEMKNYRTLNNGEIESCGGSTILHTIGSMPGSMIKPFTDDIMIVAYGDTVSKYVISTDTLTVIKDDFTTSDKFDGTAYGDFFFLGNGSTKIGRIDLATFTWTEITDAPKANIISKFGGRLFANDVTKKGVVYYSQQDTDIATTPFTNWTTIATPALTTDPGTITNRNNGEVTSIFTIGQQIVIGYEQGKSGSRITTLDVYNVGLAQKLDIDFDREDFGMNRGAIITPKGVFYTNKTGIWRMYSGGSVSQPFNASEANITKNIYNPEKENIDFSDNDLIFDDKNEIVYITCKKEASYNNFIIAYDINNKSIHTIDGLKVARFMKVDDTIYGIGSLTGDIYELFNTPEQNGETNFREFAYELNLGTLDFLHRLEEIKVKGFWEQDAMINIQFDIYDKRGILIENYKTVSLSTNRVDADSDGFNDLGFGGALGGAMITPGVMEMSASKVVNIKEFQRLIIRIKSQDKLYNKINYIKIFTSPIEENTYKQNII